MRVDPSHSETPPPEDPVKDRPQEVARARSAGARRSGAPASAQRPKKKRNNVGKFPPGSEGIYEKSADGHVRRKESQ
jgi:hypothetical protein